VRPALPPGASASLLWCVCFIQHDRDDFDILGAGAWDYCDALGF
jgi:hypothetical protein